MSNFKERIQEAYNESPIKKGELARHAEVALSTVSRWFKGTSEPRGNTLMIIASALSVNAKWLLTGEGEKITHTLEQTKEALQNKDAKKAESAKEWVFFVEEYGKNLESNALLDLMELLLLEKPTGYEDLYAGFKALMKKRLNRPK